MAILICLITLLSSISTNNPERIRDLAVKRMNFRGIDHKYFYSLWTFVDFISQCDSLTVRLLEDKVKFDIIVDRLAEQYTLRFPFDTVYAIKDIATTLQLNDNITFKYESSEILSILKVNGHGFFSVKHDHTSHLDVFLARAKVAPIYYLVVEKEYNRLKVIQRKCFNSTSHEICLIYGSYY